MKKNLIIGLIGVCFLFSGCGKGEQTTAPESQTGQNVMQSEATESVGQTAPDMADYQEPEEVYYSNDEGEILKIEKAEDGTYNIEYSVYHLLYVESAIGSYDSQTGKLHFAGVDDAGGTLEADIENKGEYLEVTVTESSHEDIVGMTQDFYSAEEP